MVLWYFTLELYCVSQMQYTYAVQRWASDATLNLRNLNLETEILQHMLNTFTLQWRGLPRQSKWQLKYLSNSRPRYFLASESPFSDDRNWAYNNCDIYLWIKEQLGALQL